MKPYAAQAERLASAIANSGKTNAAVADLVGMARQSLANMLAGNVPGHAHLPKLARELGVPLEWLIGGDTPSGCSAVAEGAMLRAELVRLTEHIAKEAAGAAVDRRLVRKAESLLQQLREARRG